MIDVKVSLASHGNNLTFKNFISKNKQSDVNFHINSDISTADFWFIFEDLNVDEDVCTVPKTNIFYFNNETSFPKDYFFQNYMDKYLSQFEKTFGCYANSHPNHKFTLPFLPWMIHGNHGDSIYHPTELNADYLSKLKYLDKPFELSVICSNKSHTDNHSLRFEFVKILKDHFGDRLIWRGNGINPISKKSELIFKSKYHLSIENDSRNNLISEKIYDSFLGLSVPIYYGAPNVLDYFKKDSLFSIDINNVNDSIVSIEKILSSNYYEKNFDNLLESRDLVLGNLNLHNRLVEIVEINQNNNLNNKELVVLFNMNFFWKKYSSNKTKIKKNLKRRLRIN